MVFSSIVFLLYFLPIFLLLYFLADARYKNALLLAASVIFYSWGAPLFIFVILGTTFLDFHLVRWMHASSKKVWRRFLLVVSVCMNLGLLFYFKYALFAIENINTLLSWTGSKNILWQEVALPIGISFFTFESLTYVVDVYRGVHTPLKKFWNYQLYIILFPKLIAGPIVRYHDIASQLTDRFAWENIDQKISGMFRFVIGLSKKVIIANSLAPYADNVFNADLSTLNSSTIWMGALCYTFQIYFDFSGYSDMAIGLLKMMGFSIGENFNFPYIANSITDFWRRWHISLGAWMKNYLYIPLGGNRVHSQARLYFNLWVVFLASGLWHGASWNFVAWGAYHGFWLVAERAVLLRLYERTWQVVRVAFTFLIVVIGWVFFREETWSGATAAVSKMFYLGAGTQITVSSELFMFFVLAAILSFIGITGVGKKLSQSLYAESYSVLSACLWGFACLLLLIIDISFLASADFNPFIYFRF